MSVTASDFQGWVLLCALIHKANTNRNTEMTAVQTALGTDTTLHDVTIEQPPVAVQPGYAGNTRLTNALNLLVNKGKSGNLAAAAMATAIGNIVTLNP